MSKLHSNGRGRLWTWPSLIVGVLVFSSLVPTWGFSVVLAPIGALFTVPALRWSRHDGLFWVAFGFNAVNMLVLLSYAVAWLTGDMSVGVE